MHIPKYTFLEMDLEVKEQEPQSCDRDVCLAGSTNRLSIQPSTSYTSVSNTSLLSLSQILSTETLQMSKLAGASLDLGQPGPSCQYVQWS